MRKVLTMEDESKTIGMIGIGGSGMRGLAYLLAKAGNHVIGTDDQYENLTTELKNEPYTLMNGQSFTVAIKDCDSVIYTDAIKENNPLVAIAKQNNITVSGYNQALGELSQGYTTIAIAGTHGKSTTTAMLSQILVDNKNDPTVIIGAGVPQWNNRHAREGKGEYMIVEADEYRDHFLTLRPKYIIITSIEHDHPDYFPGLEDTLNSFQQFLNNLEPEGKVITLQSITDKYKSLQWPDGTLSINDRLSENIKTTIPGEHMRLNALLAINLADQLGIERDSSMTAISNFQGISRRFEVLGEYEGMEIVSDYGHHPTEIKETLKATKEKYGEKRILTIFEGHTAGRLDKFKDQFVKALSKNNELIIAPTYAPKGRNDDNITEQALSNIERDVKNNGIEVTMIKNYKQLPLILASKETNYDVVIGFSAGNLDRELRKIVNPEN